MDKLEKRDTELGKAEAIVPLVEGAFCMIRRPSGCGEEPG
ncbi:hypothetical protein GGQ74_001553 [Desulfobaculum xiamenense]|uniref:Uncharacterized protein n=2 Tax=Desulfobaculum xiamenense TaxID=995050 RepID=A0A846QNQ9_9BACT|nr:hypothetical protein [Desulfobaculum xiamenense]